MSVTDHDLWSFCALLPKPKLMLFLFSVYSQFALLVSLLSLDPRAISRVVVGIMPIAMLHIIGLSSSLLPPFSPVVTSALMFFC